MNWMDDKAHAISVSARTAAQQRQAQLTKPPGSLGRLEALACQLAGLQGRTQPVIKQPVIRIFAADHGVVAEGVSAFPQDVTAQMIINFIKGGAAISVLAREAQADFAVVNVGTVSAPDIAPDAEHLQQHSIAPGTRNFCQAPAMTAAQLQQALGVGKCCAEELADLNCDLFIGGEMGIGNTTAAAALACAVLDRPAADLVGPGSGLDDAGLQRKIAAVQRALSLHKESLSSALDCLRCLGGFEIVALVACYIRCAQLGIPVLVDGFICTCAALLARQLNPSVIDWCIFSHQSTEPGCQILFNALKVSPVLALNLRLGEGSGAALALPILRLACALHNNMATFAEAGVSKA